MHQLLPDAVQIKMIEVKLSQGAKPAHGGILPADKITPAIAEARGVALDKDCISPPRYYTEQ
jgi:glutamate synthase domain-containing protein 2